MPYTWILECLKLYKMNKILRAFIMNLMGMWGKTLKANCRPVTQVTIKCRIYQEDTQSPLLFYIVLNLLSLIIEKTSVLEQVQNGANFSHHIYMDDIKL